MSIVPADPERAVRFDLLERAIRTFHSKTWTDWYREVPAATPATLVIEEADHTSLYRPKRDTICLYVTADQFDEDAADALPWPTWKIELVHEMLHEWEHQAVTCPTAAGEALWRQHPAQFDADHQVAFFTAIVEKAAYFDLAPEDFLATL